MAIFTWALATASTWCAAAERCRRGSPAAAAGRRRGPSRTAAHAPERLDHPAHRPAAQRGVAGEDREPGHAGQHAGQQPQAGAGVAAVDDVVRLAQSLGGGVTTTSRPLLADTGAEPLHRPPRRVNVLGAEQAAHPGLALGQRGEEQRPVGDRLVAGHLDGAAQRAARGGR